MNRRQLLVGVAAAAVATSLPAIAAPAEWMPTTTNYLHKLLIVHADYTYSDEIRIMPNGREHPAKVKITYEDGSISYISTPRGIRAVSLRLQAQLEAAQRDGRSPQGIEQVLEIERELAKLPVAARNTDTAPLYLV